jgi:Mrp family chromosome partitioning ATPase
MNASAVEKLMHRVRQDKDSTIFVDTVAPEIVQIPGLGELFSKLCFILAPAHNSVIQFIGATGGEGVSTIARGFAHMAAAQTADPILLVTLDADNGEPRYTTISHDGALDNAHEWHSGAHRPSSSAEDTNSADGEPDPIPTGKALAIRERVEGYLDVARQRFAFVVIDSTPATGAGHSLSLCAKVDGVVLVVAASSTRSEAARMVTEKIQSVGGRVLGIVVNRRRRYVPRFIERLLGW